MWVNQNLKQISNEEFQDKGLEWDAEDWELGAHEYFSEYCSHEEMMNIGFVPEEYDVDWEYANVRGKHEVVGPESAHVTEWRLNTFSPEWENFEASNDDAENALKWFEEHAKELNLLYKTAVHLINYTAYLNVALWQYIPDERNEELTSEEYLWETQPRHKTPNCSFFSHGFRYEYFGENVRLASLDMPEETRQLSDAEGILHNPNPLLTSEDPKTVTYPGRKYYMHLIARDLKEADESEKLIKPYLEFFEYLSEDKDNKYHQWWEVRKKWYEAVRVVRNWYYTQAYRPSNESIKESLWYIDRNRHIAKKSTSELQKIKLELLLKRWQETQTDPMDPFDLGDALKKYDKFSKEFGPILKTFGYKLELTRVDEKLIHRQEPDTLLWMGGNPQFKDMDLEDDLLKKWRNHNVHKLDNPIFQRSAELDFLLGMHENDPNFREWLRFLSDQDGLCSRHDIGYQKVRSDIKKKPSESTYRNAGMRFAEKHKLDPVKHFTELTLKNVLVSEFEGQCKTDPDYNKDLVGKLRSYINRQRDNESVIMAFLEACQKMHIDSKTVRVLFDRALPRVGFKKANSKTLYNAKHAALAFFLEENLAPKPPL